MLHGYWNEERPDARLLFSASKVEGPVRVRTVRRALHHATAEAGIRKMCSATASRRISSIWARTCA